MRTHAGARGRNARDEQVGAAHRRGWENNTQYTGNPTAIAENGSYYFGFSPLSPSSMASQSVGGVSCVRGNYIWTGEYGNQERGAVLGCESPAGRMYAIVLYADAGFWSSSESAYFEPMLGTVWWM